MAASKKVDGMLDQWLRAQLGLKAFQFQTDNKDFASGRCRDLVAAQGETLITNAPYSPETMSIIGRSWRTIGEMASVMLIHCEVAKSFWEKAPLYSVDIYNRVPPSMANPVGIRTSPYDKLLRVKPIMNALRLFGCSGFALIPVQGKSHESRSQQVM